MFRYFILLQNRFSAIKKKKRVFVFITITVNQSEIKECNLLISIELKCIKIALRKCKAEKENPLILPVKKMEC